MITSRFQPGEPVWPIRCELSHFTSILWELRIMLLHQETNKTETVQVPSLSTSSLSWINSFYLSISVIQLFMVDRNICPSVDAYTCPEWRRVRTAGSHQVKRKDKRHSFTVVLTMFSWPLELPGVSTSLPSPLCRNPISLLLLTSSFKAIKALLLKHSCSSPWLATNPLFFRD